MNNNRRPTSSSSSLSHRRHSSPTGIPSPNTTTFYKPQIYKYTCRGALHVGHDQYKNNDLHTNSTNHNNGLLQDNLPLCRGIQSKLQHVSDLPTVTSREDAVRLFEEFVPTRQYEAVGSGDDRDNHHHQSVGNGNHYSSLGGNNNNKNKNNKQDDDQTPQQKMNVSCYGTTEVNVLTVKEFESSPEVTNHENGPFLFPGGTFDPFSIFSAFEEAASNKNNNKPPGSSSSSSGSGRRSSHEEIQKRLFDQFGASSATTRSVSTSSRTTVINGKRVTTTETTTIGSDGKRHTKTEKTVYNPDGTSETTVTEDDASNQNSSRDGRQKNNNNSNNNNSMAEDMESFFSNFGPPQITRKEPEVTAIVPECRLGVTVSNVETQDHGDTIVSIRVGPVEVAVGDSYDIVEEEEEEENATSSYSNQKGGDKEHTTTTTTTTKQNDRITSFRGGISPDQLIKFKKTLERTANSMKKNAEALKDELNDDFPSRAMKGGERVMANFGKTLDRTTKLAGDLYKMFSSSSGDDDK